jgi:hypothetical protein
VDVLAEPVGEALSVTQQSARGRAVEDLAAAGDHDTRGQPHGRSTAFAALGGR